MLTLWKCKVDGLKGSTLIFSSILYDCIFSFVYKPWFTPLIRCLLLELYCMNRIIPVWYLYLTRQERRENSAVNSGRLYNYPHHKQQYNNITETQVGVCLKLIFFSISVCRSTRIDLYVPIGQNSHHTMMLIWWEAYGRLTILASIPSSCCDCIALY